MTKPKQVGLWPLIASTFFMVSGGAYGLEELVACGYGVAIAAILVTPLVWSVPTALMVGELASALPREGGYYAWVRRALGPFWGFQEAWLSLVASVFDMAIYPTLFTLYLGRVAPPLSGTASAVTVGVAIIAASAAWNLRGAATVGAGSVGLGVVVSAPFVVLTVASLAHARGAPAAAPEAPQAALSAGLVVAMWNYMGWDNVSTIAEEVARPERTYPIAVLATVGLVTLSYLLPVCSAGVAGVDPSGWTTGAWVTAARLTGGDWLAWAVVLGATVCGVGMFNALLLSYSRLPAVLAEDGYLPSFLARRDPRGGAPQASIVACALMYAACLSLGFRRLVELDILLYGASLVLEFVALVALRVREPGLPRPFKVPGGAAFAAMLGVGPALLLGVALWRCEHERVGPVSSLTLGALLVALGPVLYAARRAR
ncbi:MAG TPA: APC family permease [Polyangiaceae bacterium]|nr:APC family permease [Polyangiaceae bacterium]